MVAKIAFADARAVEETAQQLDLDALHEVIDALVAARRIDVYGVGASGFVALDFQQKLHRIGRVAFAWTDPHLALTSAALLTERRRRRRDLPLRHHPGHRRRCWRSPSATAPRRSR